MTRLVRFSNAVVLLVLVSVFVALLPAGSSAAGAPRREGRGPAAPEPLSTCVSVALQRPSSPNVSFKSLDDGSPLDVAHAAWDLLAQGDVAQGTLSVDTIDVPLPKDGLLDAVVSVHVAPARGIVPTGLRVLSGGTALTLSPADPGDRRGLLRDVTARAPAGAPLRIELDVAAEAPLERGAFRLALGAVDVACGRETPGVPLDVHLALPHGDATATLLDGATPPLDATDDGSVLRAEATEDARTTTPVEIAWTLATKDVPAGTAWVRPRHDRLHEVDVLIAAPAPAERAEPARAQDVTFIVDTSGSMRTERKLEKAVAAIHQALGVLRPGDGANVVAFDADPRLALPSPEPVRESKDVLDAFLDGLVAQGGTRLAPALQRALETRAARDSESLIVVLSDGMLQDEDEVVRLVSTTNVSLLLVSIGDDAQRAALRRIAEAGRGEAATAEPDRIASVLGDLLRSFAAPVAWNLRAEWDGATLADMRPSRLADLHAGRPVVVRAIVDGELPRTVRVRGTTREGEDGLDLLLPVEGAQP